MRSEYAAKAFDTLDHEKIKKLFRLIWMASGMSQTEYCTHVLYLYPYIHICIIYGYLPAPSSLVDN